MKSCKKIVVLTWFFCMLFSLVRSAVTDTTILYSQKKAGQILTKIYISPIKNDWHYDSLKSFDLSATFEGNDGQYPYGSWIELKLYNNKYYAYYPCDLGDLRRFIISKNSFKVLRAETDDNRIVSSKQLSPRKFSFELEDPYESKRRTVVLHIIDSKRGLGIVENVGEKLPYKYTLVLDSKELRHFPLIVNDCNTKGPEFNFSPPNYNLLIKENSKLPLKSRQ